LRSSIETQEIKRAKEIKRWNRKELKPTLQEWATEAERLEGRPAPGG
jgi:hypothetical protein